jgi:multidrug efflux pump subunit AcrA (membrane-fusion protein)
MKNTLAVAAVLAAFLTNACSRPRTAEASSTAPTEVPSVAVARAKREDISRKLTLSAEFRPFQEIDVMAKVAGYVRQINVDVGDRVRQANFWRFSKFPR